MESIKLKSHLDKNAGLLYGKAVCIVSENGERIFAHNINCGMDSVFDLASVTKTLTGTMIFKLIGEGRLALNQTLDDIFKSAPLGSITKERFKNITLQRLLTHSSGLPAWFPFYTKKGSFWEVLEFLLNKFPSQEGTAYSDPNFMLLGEVISAASSLTLINNLDILNTELETSFTYNPCNPEQCVETERGNRIEEAMCAERGLSFDGFRDTSKNMQGQVNDGNAFYFWKGVAGHAGIFGTAADLIKLARLYENHGNVNGKEFIPSWLLEKAAEDHGGGRGLMWAVGDIFIGGFGHTGFTGTSLYICPEKSAAAVILTNRQVIEPAPDLRNFRIKAHEIISGRE